MDQSIYFIISIGMKTVKKKSKVSTNRFTNTLNQWRRVKIIDFVAKSTSVGNKVVSMRNRVRRFVMVASVSKYFQSTETEQCRLE